MAALETKWTFRIIAGQALLWIGVGLLVNLAAGIVFHLLYGAPLSPRGAAIIGLAGSFALTLGKRLIGLDWRPVVTIGLALLGLALVAGPIRSFSFEQLDSKDLGLIAAGVLMMTSGIWLLRQPRDS